jgi:hypothetical protein
MQVRVACGCLAGLLAVLASRASADQSKAEPITNPERKALATLVARILETDFKLVPAPTASGTWNVRLAVRDYTKSASANGVRVEPRWDRLSAQESSLADLQVAVEVAEGFCGGQERSFLVVISSRRSPDPLKVYGIFARRLGKQDYMDLATCLE